MNKMSDLDILPQQNAREVIELVFSHLDTWAMKSAETFRNAILGDEFLAVNPMLNVDKMSDVEFLKSSIKNAVAEGRMIDFGHIPNRIIIEESVRAREMFEANELQHPYESWLAVTSWEGGYNGYYIAPHPKFTGATLVVELYGVTLPNIGNCVLIYDLVSIEVRGQKNTLVSPANMTYVGHVETEQEQRLRGSNSLDPLVTMLRLLADASIPIEHREAPERLNRARARRGQHRIPDHSVVNTKDYVANFHASAATGVSKGGHHASPIAHWRRAHWRHLQTGKVVPVRSSKVNWREAEELHRLFYRVPT